MEPNRRRRRERSTVDYLFAALFQLGVLVMINSWRKWVPYTLGVVTPDYEKVVWAANLATSLALARAVLLAIARPQWLFYLTQMLAGVGAFISTLAFVTVFPFNFSIFAGPWMNPLMHFVLLIALAATALSVVVNAARFIFGGPRETPRPLGAR